MKNETADLKSRTFRSLLKRFTGAVFLALMVGLIVHTQKIDLAEACRDCPFPTPLSKLHWLMPGGHSEIMVEEINLGGGRIQSIVRLIDAMTGDLLAIGHLDHAKGRKRIAVKMRDMAGGEIAAELYYANVDRDRVRIKISCQKCNLTPAYMN